MPQDSYLRSAMNEFTQLLSKASGGVNSILSFINDRWWLHALADIACRFLSEGKVGFPQSRAQAMTSLGALGVAALSKLSEGMSPDDIIRELSSNWQTRIVIAMARDDGSLNADIASATDAICRDIPPDETLPQWLSRMTHITGYSSDRIQEIRRAYERVNQGD